MLLVVVLLYFIAKEACEMRDERRATGSVLGYFASLENWLDLIVYGPLFLSLVSYRVVARRAGIPPRLKSRPFPSSVILLRRKNEPTNQLRATGLLLAAVVTRLTVYGIAPRDGLVTSVDPQIAFDSVYSESFATTDVMHMNEGPQAAVEALFVALIDISEALTRYQSLVSVCELFMVLQARLSLFASLSFSSSAPALRVGAIVA